MASRVLFWALPLPEVEMLGQALIAFVLLAVLGLVGLESSAVLARAAIAGATERALAAGERRAASMLRENFTEAVVANGTQASLTLPPPLPASAACDDCRLLVAATFELAGDTAGGNGESIAANVQTAGGVDERRVATHVHVTVTSASGTVLAVRDRVVQVRLFATAPYVAFDAAASAASADTAAAGASAGSDPDDQTDDTRIHAVQTCDTCRGPVQSADAFATQAWTNAWNAQSGWSR